MHLVDVYVWSLPDNLVRCTLSDCHRLLSSDIQLHPKNNYSNSLKLLSFLIHFTVDTERTEKLCFYTGIN